MQQIDLWYAIPLVVSVSLVFGATRHEEFHLIWRNALRSGAMGVAFMLTILAVLFMITRLVV